MRLFSRSVLFLAILAVGSAWAVAIARTHDEKPTVTADQALAMLKEGNEKFVADRPAAGDIGSARRHELAKGQHPFAVVVTCADSRVPPEFIFHQGLGDLFVVRVAGNIADPDVIGSVEYAVEHLHAPLVVVLGHEKCGAVTAAMSPDKPEGNLGHLLSQIAPGKPNGSGDAALSAAVRNNAQAQLKRMLTHSEVLKTSREEKKAKFVTGIYHLDDGAVEWLADEPATHE